MIQVSIPNKIGVYNFDEMRIIVSNDDITITTKTKEPQRFGILRKQRHAKDDCFDPINNPQPLSKSLPTALDNMKLIADTLFKRK